MAGVTDSPIPPQVRHFLAGQGAGEVIAVLPLAGGSINQVCRITTESGQTYVLKENKNPPPGFFQAEALGLTTLAQAWKTEGTGGPRVPRVLAVGTGFLLIEDLDAGRPNWQTWARFGRQLASLHLVTSDQFGFPSSNYLGLTPQDNTPKADGFAFFAENRLLAQGERAVKKGLLGTSALRRLETLAGKLADLIPPQPPSLVHGDLWSGNILVDSESRACLVDPACHYGWAEADLAMAHLFGTLPRDFHQAYQEVRPLEGGYRDRFRIYNLYHLLNHLNLFGLSYAGEVLGVIRDYV